MTKEQIAEQISKVIAEHTIPANGSFNEAISGVLDVVDKNYMLKSEVPKVIKQQYACPSCGGDIHGFAVKYKREQRKIQKLLGKIQ